MRPYILLLAISITVALVAAMLVRGSVGQPEQAAQNSPNTIKILVALETIPAGSFVRSNTQLGWSSWPQEKVSSPPYFIEKDTTLESFNGSVARRTVLAGEPIAQGSIVKSGEGSFMSAVLQAGKRAVSIAVTATSGNAGFIFPGDNVDLILTHAISEPTMMSGTSNTSYASETFVENVRVLAIDQMLDNPENKALLAKTVTLEVTPDQAEAINVAGEMGKIALSLRSLASDKQKEAPDTQAKALEKTEVGPKGESVSLDYFYPGSDAPAPAPENDSPGYTRDSDISHLLGGKSVGGTPTKVRVIRGGESSEQEF